MKIKRVKFFVTLAKFTEAAFADCIGWRLFGAKMLAVSLKLRKRAVTHRLPGISGVGFFRLLTRRRKYMQKRAAALKEKRSITHRK